MHVAMSPTPTSKKPVRLKWGAPGSRVTRKTDGPGVFSAGKRRPVVVSVYPDGTLGLRLLRHKREYFVSAETVYKETVLYTIAAERAKRKGKR
jgi:hypothetical protein